MSALENTPSNHETNRSFSNCRFCATQMDKKELMDLSLDRLFENYVKMLNYLKLDVDLSDDMLPNYACFDCHTKCLECFNFYITVKRSQKTLNMLYRDSKSDIVKNSEASEVKLEAADHLNSSNSGDLTIKNEDYEMDEDLPNASENNYNDDQNVDPFEENSSNVDENTENNSIHQKDKVLNEDSSFAYSCLDNEIAHSSAIMPIKKFISRKDDTLRNTSQMDMINTYCKISRPNTNLRQVEKLTRHTITNAEKNKTKNSAFDNVDDCINLDGKPNNEPQYEQEDDLDNADEMCKNFDESPKNFSENHSKLRLISTCNTEINKARNGEEDDSDNVDELCTNYDETMDLSDHNLVIKDTNDNSKSNNRDVDYIIELNNLDNVDELCRNDDETKNLDNNSTKNLDNNSVVKDTNDNSESNSSDVNYIIEHSDDESDSTISTDTEQEEEKFTWRYMDKDNTYSWLNYLWTCEYCKMDCESMEDLREHSKGVHNKCYGFRCADCDGDFNMFNIFVEHVRWHRSRLSLFCQYCNEQFENESDCHQHALSHWDSPICEFCGEICTDSKALASHRGEYKKKTLNTKTKQKVPERILLDSDMTWLDYKWSCILCFKVEPDIESLRSHFRDAHQRCYAMKCCDCSAVVGNFRLFVRHVRAHRPYLDYLCEYCNHRVSAVDELQPHLDHHLTNEHPCHGCGDTFQTHETLLNHILSFNTPLENKSFRENVTCQVCSKTYTTLTRLKQHLQQHKPKKKYICEICGKEYKSIAAYTAHAKAHNNIKDNVCKICQKTFAMKHFLRRHALLHLAEKRYACDYCGKKFGGKKSLRGHIYSHLKIKPYSCLICKKKFAQRSNLKKHRLQHTGQMPYKCEQCGRMFVDLSNCNKHMKRKHGTSAYKTKVDMTRIDIDKESPGDSKLCVDAESREWLSKVTAGRRRKKEQ